MRELTPKGKKIIRLAFILGAVIFGGLIWWALSLRDNPTPAGQTSSPLVTETPSGFTGQLPYTGDGFTIDYLADEETYVVNIYQDPVEEIKAEAKRYLERRGAKFPPSKITYFLGPDVSEHTGP